MDQHAVQALRPHQQVDPLWWEADVLLGAAAPRHDGGALLLSHAQHRRQLLYASRRHNTARHDALDGVGGTHCRVGQQVIWGNNGGKRVGERR